VANQGRMKAKVLEIREGHYDAETVEAELNEALEELAEYYITDVRPIGEGLIAILYFSKKKKKA
jgi:hypothetical protein